MIDGRMDNGVALGAGKKNPRPPPRGRTLYGRLGLTPDASPDEIKAAYRKLAKQHHPDAGGDPAKFAPIAEAYAVLSDPERRKRYDETGEANEPVDNTRAQAIGLISDMLSTIMQHESDPFDCDLIAEMKIGATTQRDGIEKQSKVLTRAKERLTKARGRFKLRMKDSEDVIDPLLRSHMVTLDRALADLTARRAVCDMALALLDEYRFEQDAKPAVEVFMQMFSSATGGGARGGGGGTDGLGWR